MSSSPMVPEGSGSVRQQDSYPVLCFSPGAHKQPSTPPLIFSTKLPPPSPKDKFGLPASYMYNDSMGDFSTGGAMKQDSYTNFRFEDTPVYLGRDGPSGEMNSPNTPSVHSLQMELDQSNPAYNLPSLESTPLLGPQDDGVGVVRVKDQVKLPSDWEEGGASDSNLNGNVELSPQVIHRALQSKCRFIAFPSHLPPANHPTSGQVDLALFIGQVRFETSPAELIWLIHRTCGACASHLESRGAGCYLLYLKSQADLALVRGLHKRILFDIGGVWLARSPEEVDALCEYVAVEAPALSKKARLPRDSMVVEELKVDATSGNSHNNSGGNSYGMAYGGHHSGGGQYHHSHHGGGNKRNSGVNGMLPPPPPPHLHGAMLNGGALMGLGAGGVRRGGGGGAGAGVPAGVVPVGPVGSGAAGMPPPAYFSDPVMGPVAAAGPRGAGNMTTAYFTTTPYPTAPTQRVGSQQPLQFVPMPPQFHG